MEAPVETPVGGWCCCRSLHALNITYCTRLRGSGRTDDGEEGARTPLEHQHQHHRRSRVRGVSYIMWCLGTPGTLTVTLCARWRRGLPHFTPAAGTRWWWRCWWWWWVVAWALLANTEVMLRAMATATQNTHPRAVVSWWPPCLGNITTTGRPSGGGNNRLLHTA